MTPGSITLAQLLKDKKISRTSLSRMLGVSRQCICSWVNGKSVPKGKNLLSLASILGIPPALLNCGDNAMMTVGRSTRGLVVIPLVDSKSMSIFMTNIESITMTRALLESRYGVTDTDRLGLHLIGSDDMSPTIPPMSVVIVDVGVTTIKDDHIYLIKIGRTTCIKYIQRRINGSYLIRSDNPRIPEFIASAEEAAADIKIIGRCLGHLSLSARY